jgi:hypothetical protein
MIAGLALQVLFTMVFCIILGIIHFRVRRDIYVQRRQLFMLGMWFEYSNACLLILLRVGSAIAAACLFIRSCWRAAELSGGFNGPLASKEGIFIALDSIPIVIMSILLTMLHSELWFRGGNPGLDKVVGMRLSPL